MRLLKSGPGVWWTRAGKVEGWPKVVYSGAKELSSDADRSGAVVGMVLAVVHRVGTDGAQVVGAR